MKPGDDIPVSFDNARLALRQQITACNLSFGRRVKANWMRSNEAILRLARLQAALAILDDLERIRPALDLGVQKRLFQIRSESVEFADNATPRSGPPAKR